MGIKIVIFLIFGKNFKTMNVKLGKYNQLEVVKTVDFGVYLNGGDDGEILLPSRYVPEGCKLGDVLNVFIYLDNEERLVATTLEPYVQVGEFACLEVAWVNEYGAFLDWGLMKDLFVPFREQKMKIIAMWFMLMWMKIAIVSWLLPKWNDTYPRNSRNTSRAKR